MSFPDLSGIGKRWLIVAAFAAVIAAFVAGLLFGPREFVPALAQPAPEETPVSQDPATQPAIELDPLLPIPEGTVTIVKIPRVVPDRGPPAGPRSADGGPPPGRYVYLYTAHRYVSLPDDVKMIQDIEFGSCIGECPVMPLRIFQRGEAIVGLDDAGVMWDVGEGTDFSAFPFFVFEEGDDR